MMYYEFNENGLWIPAHGLLIPRDEFREMVEDMPEDW